MAFVAVRTWHKGISGFFPPQPLGLAGQEQGADLRHREVPQEGVVLANREMTQTEFILFVFQRAVHRPTGETDVPEDFEGRARTGVAKKVFFFFRLEDVAGIDEPIGAQGQLQLRCSSRNDFQQELLAPAAAPPFHYGALFVVGMLLQQR